MPISRRLRAFERGAGCEPSKNRHGWTGARRVSLGIQTPGDPVVVIDGKSEAFGHHANDRVRGAAELNRAAEHVRIAAETAPPHVMADHHDVWRARPLVFRQQVAAALGRDAGEPEARRRHLRGGDCFGVSPFGDQRAADGDAGADVFQ
jgi:hypothetical protein